MFDLGWTELLLIGIVALIVVGPKELPVLFRKAGQFVGKIRGMAREFSRAMNSAADDAGVGDISSTIRSAANPLKSSVDAVKSAATDYASYDPDTETGRLAGERAEQAKKIREHAEKKAFFSACSLIFFACSALSPANRPVSVSGSYDA